MKKRPTAPTHPPADLRWLQKCQPIRLTEVERAKRKGPGRHLGVLVEWMQGSFVVERHSDRGAHVISLADFSGGGAVTFGRSITAPSEIHLAHRRMCEILERAPGYDLFRRNCEHFARFVIHGQERSSQIDGLLTFGAIGLGLWIVLGKQ